MQLVFNALIAGSLAALMAGGLSLVYGVLGIFNLALGQLALVGGYATWWLHHEAGLPLLPSIFGGVGIGALVSGVTFEVAIAPFYRRHRFLPLVTTIAWSMILDGLLLLLFQESPRSILSGLKRSFDLLGARISVEQIVLVALTLLFLSAVAWALHSTPLGRRIRASAEGSEAAESLGISSQFLHRFVFLMSGVLATLGGIYIGIDHSLTPVLGFPITIKAYAALIAGGKDNFWGTILCAYLIALVEQFAIGVPYWGNHYVPASFQGVVALLFIVAVLLFKPVGLFSRKVRAA